MKNITKVFTVMAAIMFLSITVLELNADARFGGGRSFGSRSRSYSRPATPSYSPKPSAPASGGLRQSGGGGFMRSMAGGMAGGMLGSMLFGGTAGAGDMGDGTGSGGGLFTIILLAGGGYLLYRFMKKRREDQ